MQLSLIGKILTTHGLNGGLKIFNYSDFIEHRYKKGNELYYGEDSKNSLKKSLIIKNVNIKNKYIYLTFENYENIELAKQLLGYYLYIDATVKIDLKEGYYFHKDLVDCSVYTQNEKFLGTLYEIDTNTRQDIFRVKTEKDDLLIPFVGHFVVDIDIKNKKIIVDNVFGENND